MTDNPRRTDMSQTQPAPSFTKQLDALGEEQAIFRNDEESDEAYADRIIFELDVYVEELWAHQDKVRALMQSTPTTSQE
jgi:hypothetical protein